MKCTRWVRSLWDAGGRFRAWDFRDVIFELASSEGNNHPDSKDMPCLDSAFPAKVAMIFTQMLTLTLLSPPRKGKL